MSTSERAIANLPERDQPISEQFRIVARQWVDADAAATLMEELKTTTLEKLKSSLIAEKGDMADNKAERLAKCSSDWETYIRDMCGHRAKANRLKMQMKYLEIRHREWVAKDATARAEMRL